MIAREAQRDHGLALLESGQVQESSPAALATREVLQATGALLPSAMERVDHEFALADKVEDTRLVTVLDSNYPAYLPLIPDLPRSCSSAVTYATPT